MGKKTKWIEGATSAELRQQYLDRSLKAEAEDIFRRDEGAKSVMLVVSQLWCDEAADAVHLETFPCDVADPVFPESLTSNVFTKLEEQTYLDLSSRGRAACGRDGDYGSWPSYPQLDDNSTAITAFAACCAEVGIQEDSILEHGTPYAVAVRQPDGSAQIKIVGRLHRPEWEDRFDVGFEMESGDVTLARLEGDWSQSPGPTAPAQGAPVSPARPGFWKRLFGGGRG